MNIFKKITFIALYFLVSSCNSDSDTLVDEPKSVSEILAFINAKINAVDVNTNIASTETVNYQATINYLVHNNTNGDCANYNYRAGLSPIADTNLPSYSIGFNKFLDEMTQDCTTEFDDFELLFEEGTYNYAATAQDYGVNVRYIENINDVTKTYSSYGAQNANSNFEILEFEAKDCLPKKCVNVLGTFNARLYNVNNFNDFIDVTEGEFKIRVQSFNP